MVRNPFQLSLRASFLLLTVFLVFLGMYISMWTNNPLIPAFITLVTSSVSGIAWQWRRKRHGFPGAMLGGIIGANLAVALHFICGYTMIDYFEDEGLGIVRGVLAFAPYATFCGMIVGSFLWLIAWAIVKENERDARNRSGRTNG